MRFIRSCIWRSPHGFQEIHKVVDTKMEDFCENARRSISLATAPMIILGLIKLRKKNCHELTLKLTNLLLLGLTRKSLLSAIFNNLLYFK